MSAIVHRNNGEYFSTGYPADSFALLSQKTLVNSAAQAPHRPKTFSIDSRAVCGPVRPMSEIGIINNLASGKTGGNSPYSGGIFESALTDTKVRARFFPSPSPRLMTTLEVATWPKTVAG